MPFQPAHAGERGVAGERATASYRTRSALSIQRGTAVKDSSIIGHVREAAQLFLKDPHVPADQNLREFYRSRRYLGSRDRRMISDLYYGLIRSFRSFLRIAGQEDFDEQIPPPELVPQVLALYLTSRGEFDPASVQEGTGVAESELERLHVSAERSPSELLESRRLAGATGFPDWFVERILLEYGSEADALLQSLDGEADVALRFDPERISSDELHAQIATLTGVPPEVSNWSDNALLLTGRATLKDLPAVRTGMAMVQDVGSQMVALAADPSPGMHVFDACAGAGGKSFHMADLMRGEGSIVAHDIARSRLARLEERLRVTPRSSIDVMYPDRYVSEKSRLVDSFDLVLLDAPCSGTGTFRRNPGLKLTLRPTDVERARALQWSVFEEYSPLVRTGGILVYATCSLLREENQEMVERFLESNPGFRIEPISPERGVPAEMIRDGLLRTRPDEHGTDGFFAARLRRIG